MATKHIVKYCELLAEYSDDIIWVMDKNLKTIYMSSSVKKHSGFTVDEALSLPIDKFYPAESLEIIADSFKKVKAGKNIKNGATPQRIELKAYNKDGSIDWIEVQANIIHDENGDVDCVIGITRKISARKKEEQERTEFTRALVHELKSPLTAITASCKLQLEITKDDNIKRLANNIYRGAEQINKRADELLELARGEQHMLRLYLQKVNFNNFIKNITDENSQMFTDNGVSFITDIYDSLPTITIDETRIRQVIQNLLNNAYKYTSSGDMVILRCTEKHSDVTIEVEDTGIGISKDQQAEIFKPYVLKIAEGEQVKGLGLGLALAKTFVESHGGDIWVKSKVNKGSTFGFSLPIRELIS
ncbi:ATP-binding protein [Chloroflexota bacterium]